THPVRRKLENCFTFPDRTALKFTRRQNNFRKRQNQDSILRRNRWAPAEGECNAAVAESNREPSQDSRRQEIQYDAASDRTRAEQLQPSCTNPRTGHNDVL